MKSRTEQKENKVILFLLVVLIIFVAIIFAMG